ncbi:uncharacterized protein [Miscanthus floridulus]|uniref:uncharacterized protein n=1 Tax=Miscanthus floridulus TaxID=154761 RepID=UPI00345915E0
METVLSVILGEIAHRSISFLINKFSNEAAAALPPDENLRRVLMRVHIVVEEAEGRQIRNQAMLQQLKILSATMYRGYYVLDTFRYAANDSKVIICSRSDEISRFGTAPPLRVEYLTQEAYWYFFKDLAFGSANPKEEPKLASMAMEIAACISSSFIAANSIARILRTNFSAEFWRMCVSWVKGIRLRDGRIFGAHPIVYAHDEVHQEITLQEVLLRDVVPHGNYNVLRERGG